MSLEQNLLLLFWIVLIGLVAFTVPGGKWHAFLIAYLVGQGLAWLAGMILLEFHIVDYPVREFPRASDISITMEVMLVPVCCALYVIYEPRNNLLARIRHFAFWASGITVIDLLFARFTDLQNHHGFYWWLAFLVFGSKMLAANAVTRWFFHDRSVFRRESGSA